MAHFRPPHRDALESRSRLCTFRRNLLRFFRSRATYLGRSHHSRRSRATGWLKDWPLARETNCGGPDSSEARPKNVVGAEGHEAVQFRKVLTIINLDCKRRGAQGTLYGFSLSGHEQANCPQPGQPAPYLRTIASVRSISATFAMVQSHARTSANSPRRSS